MKIRHTKLETIARVDAEYRALDRVVRTLGDAGLRRPIPGFGARARIPRERWTAKDALAHIVEWKRQALRAVRHEAGAPDLKGLPIDRKNRVLFDRWHRRPPADVIAYHRLVHRETLKALRARPEEYYRDPPRSPQWPNDLIGHARGHRERHLEPLSRAIPRAPRAAGTTALGTREGTRTRRRR